MINGNMEKIHKIIKQINCINTNHDTCGIGVPPMTQERETGFFSPVTTLFKGSNIVGGSDAVGFVTLM